MKKLLSTALLAPVVLAAGCATSSTHKASVSALEPSAVVVAEPTAPSVPLQDVEVDSAPAQEGDWEFTLGGSGANDEDFDVGGFSAAASAGYFLSDHGELGVRQSVNYSDFGESFWNGSTRVFYDYNVGNAAFRPVLGANVGYVYGDQVDDTWSAAPEAGLKWYATPSAFVFGLAEYAFFFEDSDDVDEAFEDGSFIYTVGIGIQK